MTENTTQIPRGYMQDAKGSLIPIDKIKEIDLARDELVKELHRKAKAINALLADFKRQAMDDVEAFIELSAEKYGAHLGGKKGNVTLATFDGELKLIRSITEHIVFDERLQAAKALIDSCLNRWTEGSRSEIKVLISKAFQTDKQGKINTQRVLELRNLDIDDDEWKQAMEAISDSIKITGTKAYMRFLERGLDDNYSNLPLDFAAVS